MTLDTYICNDIRKKLLSVKDPRVEKAKLNYKRGLITLWELLTEIEDINKELIYKSFH